MALVSCPECQNPVSTQAPSCPHCGYVPAREVSPPPAPNVQSVQVAAAKPRSFLDIHPALAFIAIVVFGGLLAVFLLSGPR